MIIKWLVGLCVILVPVKVAGERMVCLGKKETLSCPFLSPNWTMSNSSSVKDRKWFSITDQQNGWLVSEAVQHPFRGRILQDGSLEITEVQEKHNAIYRCKVLRNVPVKYHLRAVHCVFSPCVGFKHLNIELNQYISNYDDVRSIMLLKNNREIFEIFRNRTFRIVFPSPEYLSNKRLLKLVIPVVNASVARYTIKVYYANYTKKQMPIIIKPTPCNSTSDVSTGPTTPDNFSDHHTTADNVNGSTRTEIINGPNRADSVNGPTGANDPTKVENVAGPTEADGINGSTKVEDVTGPTEADGPITANNANGPTEADGPITANKANGPYEADGSITANNVNGPTEADGPTTNGSIKADNPVVILLEVVAALLSHLLLLC